MRVFGKRELADFLTDYKYPEIYMDESLGKCKREKMKYLKRQKLGSYEYLLEAICLLDE